MINFLLNIDLYLFKFINTYISNPLFDILFVFFHSCHKKMWFVIPILLIWGFYAIKDKKNRLVLLLLIPLSILITDQTGKAIKNMELRNRPYMTLDIENVNLLVKATKDNDGNYKKTTSSTRSFPSNHSANIWAVCYLLSYAYNNKKRYFFTLAILVSLSRIYVGVHYPFDVLIGMTIGLTFSYFLIKITKKLIR